MNGESLVGAFMLVGPYCNVLKGLTLVQKYKVITWEYIAKLHLINKGKSFSPAFYVTVGTCIQLKVKRQGAFKRNSLSVYFCLQQS